MKNIFIIPISLICAAFCCAASAQAVLTPHFTDNSKKIVIPRDGGVSPEIHEGMIVVHKYPLQCFVKAETGEYVFGTNFAFTRGNDANSPYFSGGAMMGWRKKEGAYSNSPFIVYPDGKYRDFVGDIAAASSFCEGYALIQKGQSVIMGVKQVFIDKNGKEVFPALASTHKGTFGDMTVYPVRENRRVYYNAELKKYGYADAKGAIAIKPQFDKAQNFSEGLAAVMIKEGYNEKWGFIDLTGKMVIPATYGLKPGRFSEGLAAVRIGDESEYEMTYIDKTGKRVMDLKPWNLNEFHDGYAWVGTGCEKLFVWNREFEETRNVTQDFYHNGNGFGVCMFSMMSGNVQNKDWGFDFPSGTQALNQGGVEAGDIFAPDGTLLFHCVDHKGNMVLLHALTEGQLMFCNVRMPEYEDIMPCFINTKGEIVYYFVEGVEGFEGRAPMQIK